jgi:serine/threonine protein kinase
MAGAAAGIGTGKYGKVYEARDVGTGEAVAVKVIPRQALVDEKKVFRPFFRIRNLLRAGLGVRV